MIPKPPYGRHSVKFRQLSFSRGGTSPVIHPGAEHSSASEIRTQKRFKIISHSRIPSVSSESPAKLLPLTVQILYYSFAFLSIARLDKSAEQLHRDIVGFNRPGSVASVNYQTRDNPFPEFLSGYALRGDGEGDAR